jgi:hypothetical protein
MLLTSSTDDGLRLSRVDVTVFVATDGEELSVKSVWTIPLKQCETLDLTVPIENDVPFSPLPLFLSFSFLTSSLNGKAHL